MILRVYLSNTQEIDVDTLLKSKYISSLEEPYFAKYKNIEVKKEKIMSTIFKNKYIGKYHLNEFGKPISDSKYFNISHSHGYVCFIMSDSPIGIDIEKIRDVKEDMINYISSAEERKYIHDNESFYEIWTNKEALVKAIGTGIKTRPNNIVGLPINGIREYENKSYFNKTIKVDDFIISVSKEGRDGYDLEIINEVI